MTELGVVLGLAMSMVRNVAGTGRRGRDHPHAPAVDEKVKQEVLC